MPEGRVRFRNAIAVTARASALASAAVWLEVGRGFRWLDAAFAVGCGVLLTPFILAIHRRWFANAAPSSFLIRFVIGFAVYFSPYILLLLLPRVYLHFLHRLDESHWAHNVFFAVAWSVLMGLSRAASRNNTPTPPKPGEPEYDLTKEPWFSTQTPSSNEKPTVPAESEPRH